jgi:hypothetical protein
MTLPVSRTTEEALRQALARLIDGCPTRTDGRLTVANLAREAGMSRQRQTALPPSWPPAVMPLLLPEREVCHRGAGLKRRERSAGLCISAPSTSRPEPCNSAEEAARAAVLPFPRNAHVQPRNKRSETP